MVGLVEGSSEELERVFTFTVHTRTHTSAVYSAQCTVTVHVMYDVWAVLSLELVPALAATIFDIIVCSNVLAF